jgi:hypothetical protein
MRHPLPGVFESAGNDPDPTSENRISQKDFRFPDGISGRKYFFPNGPAELNAGVFLFSL